MKEDYRSNIKTALHELTLARDAYMYEWGRNDDADYAALIFDNARTALEHLLEVL